MPPVLTFTMSPTPPVLTFTPSPTPPSTFPISEEDIREIRNGLIVLGIGAMMALLARSFKQNILITISVGFTGAIFIALLGYYFGLFERIFGG